MTFDELFLALAKENYCPTVEQLADALGVPVDTALDVVAKADAENLLGSIVGDEVWPEQDLRPEDLPCLCRLLGKPLTADR